MEIADEDIDHYHIDGAPCSFLSDEAVHKYFHGGVPVEEIARVRGCSVSRVKTLVNRQRDTYQMLAYYARLQQQERFDKAVTSLDPSGSSALTMAYLQPLTGFLRAIAYDC